MRRTRLWLTLAMIPVACAGPATVSGPPGSAATAPPPISSTHATATQAAPSATPTASPTPMPARELAVRWRADDPTGLGEVASIIGVERLGDVYVLAAERLSTQEGLLEGAAWWSTDGKAWNPAQEFPAGEKIFTLTAGGPGFVVAGFAGSHGSVWTSVDGRVWKPVSDASLSKGVIAHLVPTASGLVGFGWRSDTDAASIWTSRDGFEWLAATNETGLTVARGMQAVGAHDGRAIAVVRHGDGAQQEIWETTGRAEWTKVGSLPTKLTVERVAGGARGWVAIGSNRAWTSTDGRHWSNGVAGPDVASDVIVDDAGFVAVGYVGSLPGETCGDQRPFAGHTWTSSDGDVWQLMPVLAEFKAAMVTQLLVVDRTLLGYGQRLGGPDGIMPVGRWTASLPDVMRSAATSDKASQPMSCGG